MTQPVGGDEADFFGRFSIFHYDVATDGEITGMDLSFDRPVSGVVIDQDLFILAAFTFDTKQALKCVRITIVSSRS